METNQPTSTPVRIRVKVDNDYSAYLRHHPFHPTQHEIASRSHYCVFSIMAVPSDDIVRSILAMGGHAEVWDPEPLKQQVMSHAQEMYNTYFISKQKPEKPSSDGVKDRTATVYVPHWMFDELVVGHTTSLSIHDYPDYKEHSLTLYKGGHTYTARPVSHVLLHEGFDEDGNTALFEVCKTDVHIEDNHFDDLVEEGLLEPIAACDVHVEYTLGALVEKHVRPTK